MTLRHAVPLVVASLALLVPAASPAATWSPAANVSSAANDLGMWDLGYDAQGRALATWSRYRWQSGSPHGHYVDDGWRAASRAPGAVAFGAERVVPTFVTPPILYGITRAVGIQQVSRTWSTCGERSTLRARFGTSSGTFGDPRTITTSRGPGGNGSPVIAANGAGIMLAAWSSVPGTDCNLAQVRAAIRRPNRNAFDAPFTLRGTGNAWRTAAAVGPGGDMLVAWSRRVGEGGTRIEARYRLAGHSWGPVRTLGNGTVAGGAPVAAIAQNGRAYVAWTALDLNETTGLHATFSVAVKPAGGSAFRTAQTLEKVATKLQYMPVLGPSIALTRNGAIIGWTGRDAANWRVKLARTNASGVFGAASSVSAAGSSAVLSDLAALPDGTSAVTWAKLDDEQLVADVWAGVRGATDGAFGAPELVNDGALRQSSVAIDPTTRQPAVLWPQRLGSTTSVSKITAYMRVSTRSGS